MKKRTIITGAILAAGTAAAATYAAVNTFIKGLIYRDTITSSFLNDDYEVVKVKNKEDLILTGYLREIDHAKRTLVMVHDTGDDATSLTDYVTYFEKEMPEINILLIDLEAHGLSDGYVRGLGYKDVIDLAYWQAFLQRRYGKDHSLVMYGKGTGASTILFASGSDLLENVEVIISDGAYSSLAGYIMDRAYKVTHIAKGVILPIARRIIKKEAHYDMLEADTVKYVKENDIPTIFIHSKEDPRISLDHVFPLYNNNKSEKVLFPIKEKHIYDMDPEEGYSQTLTIFLNNYLK